MSIKIFVNILNSEFSESKCLRFTEPAYGRKFCEAEEGFFSQNRPGRPISVKKSLRGNTIISQKLYISLIFVKQNLPFASQN